jgi:adenylate cyclase
MTIVVMVAVGLVIPSLVVGALYLRMSIAGATAWGLAMVVGCLPIVPISFHRSRELWQPIRRWASGDESAPATTWACLLAVDTWLARNAVVVGFPVQMLISFPVAFAASERTAVGTLALVCGYALLCCTIGLVFSGAGRLLVRAPLADVVASDPSVEAIPLGGGGSMRGRLVGVIVLTAMLSGLAVPSIVLGSAAGPTDYLAAMLGGAAFAAYVAWITDVGIVQSTVRPLRELLAGTLRVRQGDLSTPVPVTTADELGELASAFNQMQLGLREREALHAAFGSYVDPLLAQRLIASGSSIFEGEEVDVTVLFADVAPSRPTPRGWPRPRLSACSTGCSTWSCP